MHPAVAHQIAHHGVVPDLYENFYAISVRRHFEPSLLKALLQRPEAAVLGAIVTQPPVASPVTPAASAPSD